MNRALVASGVALAASWISAATAADLTTTERSSGYAATPRASTPNSSSSFATTPRTSTGTDSSVASVSSFIPLTIEPADWKTRPDSMMLRATYSRPFDVRRWHKQSAIRISMLPDLYANHRSGLFLNDIEQTLGPPESREKFGSATIYKYSLGHREGVEVYLRVNFKDGRRQSLQIENSSKTNFANVEQYEVWEKSKLDWKHVAEILDIPYETIIERSHGISLSEISSKALLEVPPPYPQIFVVPYSGSQIEEDPLCAETVSFQLGQGQGPNQSHCGNVGKDYLEFGFLNGKVKAYRRFHRPSDHRSYEQTIASQPFILE